MRARALTVRSRLIIVVAAVFAVSVLLLLMDSIEDALSGATLSIGTISGVSGAITSFVVSSVSSTGYVGVFSLMVLEGTSLPIPSEVVLPFAGYLVSLGRLDFWTTVLLATGAGLIGAIADYYVGLFVGMNTISKYGSRFFIGQDQMQRIVSLFERHGDKIVFLSRMVPGIRTLASFPAGSARMNLAHFSVYTFLGSFCLNAALVYVGYFFGSHWDVIRSVGTLEVGATLILIVAAVFVYLRMRGKARVEVGAHPS